MNEREPNELGTAPGAEAGTAMSLEDRIKRWLSPWGVFFGAALGFLGCCLAGRFWAETNHFRDFQRLHGAIHPEYRYYPTALQVRALARDRLPAEKVAVILGGSSIFHGTGQGTRELWSDELQRLLGARFRVLNLALPGGGPNDIGLAAAEMMYAENRKLIFVTTCAAHYFAAAPDHHYPIYRYFFHDARARGLLLDFPARSAALEEIAEKQEGDAEFEELQLRSAVNAVCSVQDLWHIVAYRWFFTVWTRHGPFWEPRHAWTQHAVAQHEPSLHRRFHDERFDRMLKYQRQQATPVGNKARATRDQLIDQAVAPALKPRTLLVLCRSNPYYADLVERQSPGHIARYHARLQETAESLRLLGVNAREVGISLESADFVDNVHLTASGGRKLAQELAPAIEDLAYRLGYLSPVQDQGSVK